MNQRAVALAADSAVTLIDGGTVVVRNDQRKLFNLGAGLPVGVMFFGVADLMGHPWEGLIEHFQAQGKVAPLPHVRDHAAAFTAILDHLEEFFPRERQKDEYKRLLASVFRYIFHLAQYLKDLGGSDRAQLADSVILKEAIDLIWRDYQFRDDGSPRRDLPCFPPGFGAQVAREYATTIDELIDYGFSGFALDAATRQHLREIAVMCVVKDLFLEDVTGLVFAGFGTAERYPAVSTYFLSAVVGGIAKRAEVSTDAIDNEVRSKIRVFADCEATTAFIRGIDYGLERRIYTTIQTMMRGLVDHVVGAFVDVEAAQRDAVRRRFHSQYLGQYFSTFQNMISDYQQQVYINPILRVLEIAGRQELAETARELIALNVFKKRIMAQQQTVGGAIDVATISRETGFQWFTRQGG
ncbi:MAG: hypothetical protein KGJ78_08470 [Alphaproteobacteria bacterium]|nr:hypothetical protein [Alphaproteobacteria bacterium]